MWEKVRLVDICRPKQWKTLSTNNLLDRGYPVYGANGKIGFYNKYTHESPTLIITCRGATCGSLHITDPKSYVNGNAMALDSIRKDVDIKFLYYYFSERGFQDIISGSAQPQITGEGLSKITIPLPPLPIQKRIAEILDTADALRRKDEALLKKYDELAQAIFIDMFGDPVKNEKGWEVKKLGEVCEKITDGTHFSPPNIPFCIPYITAKHLMKNQIDFYGNPTFIIQKHHEEIFSRCKPMKGDVLYIKDGATTGISAVNQYDFEFSMLSSLALIKPNKNRLNSYYLSCFLNNEIVKKDLIRTYMAGAAIKRFTLDKINKFKIVIPPIELQNQFEKKWKKLQQNVEILKTKKSTNLFNSLLQKAFNGELIV